MKSSRAKLRWRPKGSTSTDRSTRWMRVCWPGGGGCISKTLTAIRSNSWRSPTTTKKTGALASPRIWSRGHSAALAGRRCPPSAPATCLPSSRRQRDALVERDTVGQRGRSCSGGRLNNWPLCCSTEQAEEKADKHTMAGVKNSKVMDTRSKSRAAFNEGLDLDRQRPRGDLGHRLRIAREEKSIGLRELARRLGVSPSLISQIETGKTEPSINTLFAMVSELELSVNEIVFESERDAGGPSGA